MSVDTTELEIYRGERKTWQGAVTDENGNPEPITGSSIYFTARSALPAGSISDDSDSEVLVAKTIGDGVVLTDPANGLFEFTMEKADTNSLDIVSSGRKYEYEIAYVANGETEPKTLALR